MKYTVSNGNEIFEYELIYKRVKNINLRVKNDGSVVVSASKFVPLYKIQDFVCKNIPFIKRVRNKLKEKNIDKKEINFETGEIIRLFGENRKLAVFLDTKNQLYIDNTEVKLYTKDINNLVLKRKIFDREIEKILENYIENKCKEYYEYFEKKNIIYPTIKYRKMTSRWGSCMYKKSIITFSTYLRQVPLQCIDYVIVHEFCHFLQPNHSKKFYNEVAKVMPNYKEINKLLKQEKIER